MTQVPEEYCWAITQVVGCHAAADHVTPSVYRLHEYLTTYTIYPTYVCMYVYIYIYTYTEFRHVHVRKYSVSLGVYMNMHVLFIFIFIYILYIYLSFPYIEYLAKKHFPFRTKISCLWYVGK